MKYFLPLGFLFFALLVSCNTNQTVSPFHASILPMGRVGANQDSSAMEIYWSGSGIQVNFEGTGLSISMKDGNFENYFNVIIDKDSIVILRPDTVRYTYVLAKDLPQGKHSIELFKRTEWTRGTTWIYDLIPDKGTQVIPVNTKVRSIEFYGNSITCGYGVEDYSGNDSPDSIFTNNYASYGALTARHFNADYSCISRSGIGLTVSWFNQIMQDIYHLRDPENETTHWDFEKYPKDIVVINLFQNDSWIVERNNHVEFKRRFGDKKPTTEFITSIYADFVSTLRGHYPNANIICMLGNMDITREGSEWPHIVESAVATLDDDKIHTLFVPYKNSPGHPKLEEQKVMAEKLIDFIESNSLFD